MTERTDRAATADRGRVLLLVWIACAVPALLPAAAKEDPRSDAVATKDERVTVGSGAEWELEGMRPGMSFRELDRRFRLQDLVPMQLPPERRYVLDATRPLPDPAQEELEQRGIAGLELVFREDRLVSVRVAYAGRAEVMFDDMAKELVRTYGSPSGNTRRGPLQVGRAHGIRLYLWLSIWTWERDGLELQVEGKHYGVDKVNENPDTHKYAFMLREAQRG
jgi:hypothetical protein